jgi:predicted membrane channel-forming protein YqfA (hemolysin III family)
MDGQADKKQKRKAWMKRMGWATILFFVIKGTITTTLLLMGGQALFKSCQ